MDWHRVASVPDRYGSGWTGYSWERELFPDPEGFLAELHRRGLRVTLNVHPADGVRGFEDAYPRMAEALGRDPESDEPIAFDITDRAFLDAYLEVVHHPLEAQGVDFWWLDWQQGQYSRIEGIDPLWMLNHFHYLDSGREGRRPLTFSRYAGPGSHRYPIGFSGDTHISWESLDFQPEFTATASNIGYGWWSHDVGGHIFGVRDDELATRWVQLGLFSPILRLHSSSNRFLVKEPWLYPAEARAAMGDALRFRHRLVPYLHTMNHRAAGEGVPLVRPMYHLAPREQRAYEVPNQFAFGSELIVAPITTPRDPVTLRGAARAWLPPGTWIDIFTSTVYDGDREVELHRDLGSVPALLRAGGILPLAAADDLDATRNPERLELLVAPGADGEFTLVEDDGTGATPDDIPTARTTIAWEQSSGVLTIGAADDPHGLLPRERSWTVRFLGLDREPVHVAGSTAEPLRAEAGADPQPRTPDRSGALFATLNAAQWGHEAKEAAWRTLTSGLDPAAMLAELHAQALPRELIGALSELLTAALAHVDRDVVGHAAEDRVVAARLLQQRAGHELVDRSVRDEPGDEALPGDAAAEVAVEPERAMAGAEDLARADRVGLRRHRGPVAAEGVQRVLHHGHRVQVDQPRAGLAVGVEVARRTRRRDAAPRTRCARSSRCRRNRRRRRRGPRCARCSRRSPRSSGSGSGPPAGAARGRRARRTAPTSRAGTSPAMTAARSRRPGRRTRPC